MRPPTIHGGLLGFVLLISNANIGMAQQSQLAPACALGLDASSLEDRVDIMHTLNTQKEVAQPALLQYTRPDSGSAYGNVSAAVRYSVCNSSRLTMGPYVEYLWSDASSKRVNTLRAGVDAEWQLRSASSREDWHSPVLLVQASHKEDRENATESGQLVAKVTWVSNGRRGPWPNTTWRLGSVADLVWSPNIGVVVENVRKAKSDSLEGTIIRSLLQMDLIVYPAAIRLERRLELFTSWISQLDLLDGTGEEQARFGYNRTGVSWFAFREDGRAAGLTLVRTQGSDPTRSILEQRNWQLGITLRVR
jgi:hypothetical protein